MNNGGNGANVEVEPNFALFFLTTYEIPVWVVNAT